MVKGKFGEVKIGECIDGMSKIPDNSYEMFLTDPPYNLKFKGSKSNQLMGDVKIFYEDNMNEEEYINWCFEWFEELQRITNFGILTPGYMNFKKWIIEYPDLWFGAWVNYQSQGGCVIASFRKWEPFITWNLENARKQHKRLKIAVLEEKHNVNQFNYGVYKHPCPKPLKLWERFILELKPKSVIDPFMGSGTTAEVCEKYGIKYIGFEKNEIYLCDIEKRIKNGMREYKHRKKQSKIENFINEHNKI